MPLDHHVADLLQVLLGRLRVEPHVELREHAVAADVRVEEHPRQLVPDRFAVRVAAAERHGHLRLLVGAAVDRAMRVEMLVRDDQPARHEVARLVLRERAVREVLTVETDQPGVRTPERETGEPVHVRRDLAHEPEEVQPLEERTRRLPRAAPRALGDPRQPLALAGGPRSCASAPRKTLLGRFGELELERVDGVEALQRRLKLLAPERIVLGAGRERRRRLLAHALETLREDRVERRHVVHVVHERPAAERVALAVPFALARERLVRHEPLLAVEAAAEVVHLARGHDAHHPSAVHAGLEIERGLGEEKRMEMLPHRAVGFAAHVERVVVGVRRRVGPQVRADRAVARVERRMLALAVALVGIERAQFLPEGRIVRGPKRIRRCRLCGIKRRRCAECHRAADETPS